MNGSFAMASRKAGEPPAKRPKLEEARSTEESPAPLHLLDSNPDRPLYFLSRARGIPHRHNDNGRCVSLAEILSPLLGDLKASVQFNYMVDMEWLMQQYPPVFRKRPLLVVHGARDRESRLQIQAAARASGNASVEVMAARLDIPYGTHHTKMMMLLYAEGMRVVIHTANLIERDWLAKTQAVWVSPLFPKLAKSREPSPARQSEFSTDLLEYLEAYGNAGTKCLDMWKTAISEHDMSTANVKIVASVPGRHAAQQRSKWGHTRLRQLLQANCTAPSSWPVVAQFSSIGSLGTTPQAWLAGEWLTSLSAGKPAMTSSTSTAMSSTSAARVLGASVPSSTPLNLVFPNVDTVRRSTEGYFAGSSLPYSAANAAKQPWLNKYMHTWKSDSAGRSRASPHIKTYARVATNCSQLAWFMVTSANLSKAAWGSFEKNKQQLFVRSYEMGVLFLPKSFGVESFSVGVPVERPLSASCSATGTSSSAHVSSSSASRSVSAMTSSSASRSVSAMTSSSASRLVSAMTSSSASRSSSASLSSADGGKAKTVAIYLPYDLPLTPYSSTDKPWTWDSKHLEPDTHGHSWEPGT